MWLPELIIVNDKVRDTRITKNVLSLSTNAHVEYTYSGMPDDIKDIIYKYYGFTSNPLTQIIRGKKIVYLAPVSPTDVDTFTIEDNRLLCPQFRRIKFASNGCPYMCDWCFLKNTFGAFRPYITIKAELQALREIIERNITGFISNRDNVNKNILFNCGELNDSLALEHLTLFAQTFIPIFANLPKGFLYLLTKSDNVDSILKLNHRKRTTIGWSMNAPIVSQHFELNAPPFEKRLEAAKKVQDADYSIRIRIDPIIKFPGWEYAYSEMINHLLTTIKPTRITLGTLRFEEKYFENREHMFRNSKELLPIVNTMAPMLPRNISKGINSIGKYSFHEKERIEIFRFIIAEVRKYSNAPIALCKEIKSVWDAVGLDAGNIQCVCQI